MRRLLLLFVLILAACGSDDDSDNKPPASRPVTLQPQPDATRLPGCTTVDLENWYEIVSTNLTEFSTVSAEAISLPAADLMPKLSRLVELGDWIARTPVPEDCALALRGQIMSPISTILATFQQYANQEMTQDEMRPIVEAANSALNNEIASGLAGTQSQLEVQLQIDAAEAQQQ
ncbi:MAG TPA: hypothetical protein VHP83_12860 [Aggregatilineaceae bacterium]|nr:hypothetical protein [Aggregatilineaceae bacterium]